jgi:hypothetical protein
MTLENVTSARLALKSAELLRNNAKIENWLGGRDSFRSVREAPMITGVRRVTLATPAISRFRILSSAFVFSRPVADFASPMTLVMTLSGKNSRVFLSET